MKYYSEKLCRTFDTAEACLSAEAEHDKKHHEEEIAKKELKEAEENLKKAVETYCNALKKNNQDYYFFDLFFD